MPIIGLVAFRGLPFSQEPALIRTGHVALSRVIPDVLIGFSPTPSAIEAAGGEMGLFMRLRAGEAQPGCLQDDTAIFLRARELSVTDEITTVWELEVEILIETLEAIKEWYNEKREAPYNFPDRFGIFKPNQYNCATFPSLLNIPIPSPNGSLGTYIEAMIENGAHRW
jgi:hypothetical protein